MANKITSTFNTTTANAMYVNVAEGKTYNKEMFIPEQYAKDNATMLKYLLKNHATDNDKPVAIISSSTSEELRAMDSATYYANGFIVEKRITSLNGNKVMTRTFNTTTANAMYVNVAEGKTYNKEMFIPEQYAKDNATMLKYLLKNHATDNDKPVAILQVVNSEELVAMTEQTFYGLSVKIESR